MRSSNFVFLLACAVVCAFSTAEATQRATNATAGHHKHKHHQHLRDSYKCLPVKNESWGKQIVSMCAVRNGYYNFYYELANGKLMRNCECESFNDGLFEGEKHGELRWKTSVVCYAKTPTPVKELIDMFKNDAKLCMPFDFN